VRSKYAYFLRQAQDMDQAYEEYAIVAEGFRHINGELHPDTLFVRQQFVECALELGEFEEALPLLQSLLNDCRYVFGPTNPATITTWKNYVTCLSELEQDEQALAEGRELLPTCLNVLGPDHRAAFYPQAC